MLEHELWNHLMMKSRQVADVRCALVQQFQACNPRMMLSILQMRADWTLSAKRYQV